MPVISPLDNGGFISAWTSSNSSSSTGGDGSSNSIKAQLFDKDGEKVGNEFLVNANTYNVQFQPSVTTLTDGDVLMTWASYHGGSYRTYGRRFDQDGNAQTSDMVMFESSGTTQYEPDISALEDGGFIVSWEDTSLDGSDYGIYSQRFSAENVGYGQVKVNDYTANYQGKPSTAGLADGGYVIAWGGRGADQTGDNGIYLRRYDANGETIAEITVNETLSGHQSTPQVTALADGGYVVSWHSNQDGSYNVYARTYNAAGEATSGELKISEHDSISEYNNDILALNDGGFMVSWYANVEGDTDVYSRRFNATGEAEGDAFRLNDYIGGGEYYPSLEQLADGRIVASWQSSTQDGSGIGVYGKLIALDGQVTDSAANGTAVGQVNVDDPDFGDTHSFALIDDASGRFSIDSTTGVITLADTSKLDYDDATSHDVVVRVTDSGGETLTQTLTIEVAQGNRAPESLSLGRVESDDFALHTYTASDQHTPVISPLDNGGFISVWRTQNYGSSSSGGDGNSDSVRAQLFDKEGEQVGSEFLVNSNTYSIQYQPSVTTLTDGDVLMTWTSYHSGSFRVYGRRFDQDGNAKNSDMVLFESSGTTQYEPNVSALEDGGFIVSWEDSSLDGDSYGIFAQRFSAENVGYGQFKVNNYTTGSQRYPSTAGLADGGYVIAWGGRGADQTDNDGIYLRRYDANGETIAEITVNETLSGNQNSPQVTALADGGYVVSWYGSSNVYARTYNAAGEATSGELKISESVSNTSDILALDDGGFVVSWHGYVEGDDDVYARRYNATGEAEGDAFRISDHVGGTENYATLAQLADGRIVATWQSDSQDGSGWGVYGKLIALDGQVTDSAANGTAVGQVNVDDPDFADTHSFVLVDDANGRFSIDSTTGVITLADTSQVDYDDATSHDVVVRVTDSGGKELEQTLTIEVAQDNRAPQSLSLDPVESDEFALHTYTGSDQHMPVISPLDSGGFISVWYSENGSSSTGGDGSGYSIKAQLFDQNGSKVGNEFLVNTNTDSYQYQPSVTTLTNGDVLMTWVSYHSGSYRTYGRRFDQDGNAKTSDMALFESSGAQQYEPDVSALADGGFIVSWEDASLDGSDYGIYAQRFSAENVGYGQVKVNSYTTNAQSDPSTAGLADGGYVIAWGGRGTDQTGDDGVYLRHYDANGETVAEITVNETFSGNQNRPQVAALADGGYVVSWSSYEDDRYNIYARSYNAEGEPTSSEVKISQNTAVSEYNSDIIALDDGGFMVSWHSAAEGDTNVYARRYNARMEAEGDAFQLNDYIDGSESAPTLAQLADGRIVATWQSSSKDGSGSGVFGKLIALDGQVMDSAGNGTTIGRVNVDDPDFADEHTFILTDDAGGRFVIDETTGEITVGNGALLNYSDANYHEIAVTVTDSAGNTLTQTMTIDVTPTNRAPTSMSLQVSQGAEFPLHTFTTDDQEDPDVIALDNGGFISVWTSEHADSSSGGDGSGFSIKAQLFGADGEPQASEFFINQSTTNQQLHPDVTRLINGDVMISWSSNHDGNYRVYGRRFDQEGNALGDEIALFETSGSQQYKPDITALADGGYLTTWHDSSLDGSGDGVFSQRFSADDVSYGQTQVNRYTAGGQSDPRTVGLPDGGYVITWTGRGADQTSDTGVYMRQYSAKGETVAEGTVTQNTTGEQDYPHITTLSNGGYVITWSSTHEDGREVFARVYASDGTPESNEISVSMQAADNNRPKDIVGLDDGGFLIAWEAENADGSSSGSDIYARRFNADGSSVGERFRLNDEVLDDQSEVKLDVLNDGRIVSLWQSANQDGSGSGIYGKVLAMNGLLKEGAANGTEVGQIAVNDPDIDDVHQFELTDDAGGRFIIDANTGVISLADSGLIDYENNTSHAVSIQVTDSAGHTLMQTMTIEVTQPDYAPQGISLESVAGDEFVINYGKLGNQVNPVITHFDDGGFIVAWVNEHAALSSGGDGSGSSIKAQRYDAEGNKVSFEYQLNEPSANNQVQPAITTLANGDVLITWGSIHQGSYYRTYGRRLDAEGTPVGEEIVLFESAPGHQEQPKVSALADGGYIVSWYDTNAADGSGSGVYAQRFDNNDQGSGQFLVNSYVTNNQKSPDTAGLPDGSYIVVWSGPGADQTGNDGVYMRHYNAEGESLYERSVSNTLTGHQQYAKVVALIDGSYVVSWSSNHNGENEVYARHFSAGGEPVGDEFKVSNQPFSDSNTTDIIALDDGGFIVSWNAINADGDGNEVYARRYDNADNAAGDAFRLSDYTDSNQNDAQLQQLANGKLATVWESSGQDGDGYGIYGRLIDLDSVVKETTEAGTVVGRVKVDDPNLGDQHQFELVDDSDGRFAIDESTGIITVVNPELINYADADHHDLSIRVTDSSGLEFTQIVTIDVTPVNDASKAPTAMSLDRVMGDEFALHTYTTSTQSTPIISPLDNGGFISVWYTQNSSSSTGGDGSSYSVKAQLFNADGEKVGNEFLVNSNTSGAQYQHSVTTLTNGDVLITWSSSHSGSYRIYGRRFDQDGNAETGDMILFESSGPAQYDPDVSALEDGGFIVSWEDTSLDGSNYGIYAQRFSADNVGYGQVLVNSYTTNYQTNPSTAGLADGGYVIAWGGRGADQTGDNGIYLRRYDANGETIAEITVNETLSGTQNSPQVTALADGGYVVSWNSNQDGSYNVYARTYNAAGEATSGELKISEHDSIGEYNNDILALDDGGFMVSWYGSLEGNNDAYARRFNASGEAVGDAFRLNDYIGGAEDVPTLAQLADGRIVASWQSSTQDGSGYGVYGKLIALDGQVTESAANGTAVGQVNVDDPDFGDTHSFMLIDDANGRFSIDSTTGVITLADTSQVDYDDASSHDVVVRVTDSGGETLEQTLTIEVAQGNRAPESLSLGRVESDDFALHTYTSSDQHTPVISPLDNGGFISVWYTKNSSSTGGDGNSYSIRAQRFDKEGEQVGSEFLVNSNTYSVQYQPSVTTLTDGDMLMTWTSYHGGSYRIYGRRFDQDGNAQTSDMVLFESSGSHQFDSDISALDDGGFIVSWSDNSLDGSSDGIYAQRFSADNVGYGQVQVNSYTTGSQSSPSTAGLADGGYVIVWKGRGADQTGDDGIYLRRYDANGETIAEITVNETLSGTQYMPEVTALADGGYVVSWSSSQDGSYNVYARIYNAAGEATGGELKISEHDSIGEYNSDILALDDGGFVVSWYGNIEGDTDVYARRYSATGEAEGDAFRISDHVNGTENSATLAQLADGRIVATWQSDSQDGSGYGVYGKLIALDSQVTDSAANGTAVGQVNVDDPDFADTHSFVLIDDANGRFSIDSTTGVITLADTSQVDYDDATSHDVVVRVTDSGGETLTQTLTIEVAQGNRAPESLSLGRVESDEFALHTYASGSQYNPVVSPLDNGGFISAWTSSNSSSSTGGDGSSNSIKAQLFDKDGEKVGNEFLVNTNTYNVQSQQSVTTLTDGDVLITWVSNHSGSYRTYGRRFDQDGNAQTSDMVLFESSGSQQYTPNISALADGGFIVSWEDNSLDGSGYGIYAQRFSAENVGYGQFKVNSYTTNSQYEPSTAGLADGGYVIAWGGRGADQTGDNGIYLRRYDANGETIAEITVNETLSGIQNTPEVTALADGGYVVSWHSNQDGSYNVYARTYNAAGEATSGELKVSEHDSIAEYNNDILALDDGGFMVSWHGNVEGDDDVYARRYSATGETVGDTFRISDHVNGTENDAALAQLADGRIVAIWESSQDTSGYGIYGKLIALDGQVTDSAANGTAVGQVNVDDPDFGDTHSFVLIDDANGRFSIDSATGVIRVADPAQINYIENSSHDLSVRVTDSAGNTLVETVTINVVSTSSIPAVLSLESAETDEFALHESTLGEQISPSITALNNGGFFSVWTNQNTTVNEGGDGSGSSIKARIHNDEGQPIGDEFYINQNTIGDQSEPSMTTLSNGDILVTWLSVIDGNNRVYGRRFSNEGEAKGSEFELFDQADSEHNTPDITALTDGGYLVTWQDSDLDSGDEGIFSQRFDINDQGQGQFSVNTHGGQQYEPETTGLVGGGYVVVWNGRGADQNSDDGIYLRHYDSDGNTVRETAVNETTAGLQNSAHVTALSDGGYVVVWVSDHDGDQVLLARRYDLTGQPVGGERQLAEADVGDVSSPRIVGLDDGGYMVSWVASTASGGGSEVYIQQYSSDDEPVTDARVLNDQIGDVQNRPDLTLLADGRIAAVWQSDAQDGSGAGVYGKVLSLEGSVKEGAANGTPVGRVAAGSTNSQYQFELTDDANGRFAIDEATGVIRIANADLIDAQESEPYEVTVKVSDETGNEVTQVMKIDVASSYFDTIAPEVSITEALYDSSIRTIALEGDAFNTILDAEHPAETTDLIDILDWSKFSYGIDDSENVFLTKEDIQSAKVWDNRRIIIELTPSKAEQITDTTGGGYDNDVITITTGFIRDIAGNAATTDGLENGSVTEADLKTPELTQAMSSDNTLTLNFSEILEGQPNNSDFTIKVNNNSRIVGDVEVNGEEVTVSFMGDALTGDEHIEFSYSGASLSDAAGNTVNGISSYSVGQTYQSYEGVASLVGNRGDDIFFMDHSATITGEDGADIFDINHLGTAESPAETVITDFNASDGDVLDISDLFVDENNNLIDLLSFDQTDSDNPVLEVKDAAGGDITHKITLQNFDLSAYGSSDSEIINNLIDDGNFIADQ
ncbi:MAG: cadherin domain-containing protein [Endozoicomonas sp. (ex Botrylloides leachii)]|nr:cadherin domain-containing protein [Endozoicomonas sp. (ex Botrylloides leachii)]